MADIPTVVVGCPVRDRAWILPYYLEHISKLDYDTRRLIPCFVVNDSSDRTEEILRKWAYENSSRYSKVIIEVFNQGQIPDRRTQEVRNRIYHSLANVRNKFLEIACNNGADYVFSIDSDILVPPNALKDLLKHNKDIIAAQIWNDASKRYPNILIDQNGVIRHYFNFPKNQLFRCDVTGAVYLISRKVVVSGVKYGYHHQGEDIAFCKDAKAKGFEIYADSNIYCEHIMNQERLSAAIKKPE